VKISLSTDVERLIAERVQSGQYATADDVVREGLELLQQHEREAKRPRSNGSQALSHTFKAIASDVPETEWERVPADLSKNLEQHLSKRRKNR